MINKSDLSKISNRRKILEHDENFAYLLPCDNLKYLISNFTITFPEKAMISDNYTVMPHGSVTIVFFIYNDTLHSFLFGPTTKTIKVGNIANKCEAIFIIEFQPAGFYPFTSLNLNELTDKIVPFSLINNSLDIELQSILNTSLSVDKLLIRFEEKLLQNIQLKYPEKLADAISNIILMEGIMTSTEISNNTFYSSRHMNRLFNMYLGMSMKSFSRLVRINKSIKLLNEKENTLNFICEQLGYYDVSHFVKDFKIVCNITPQVYRSNMSDFYSEIAKF